MRKFLTSFAAVVLALSFLSSCGTAAKDIKVADLETACDFADAMMSVSSEAAKITAEIKDDKATPEQDKEIEALTKKMTEIATAAVEKKIDMTEVAKCDGYKADK